MTVRTAVLACVLALVVVTGGVVGPVSASDDYSATSDPPLSSLQAATQNGTGPTTLTECTDITEPGWYVLGNDVGPASGDDPCLFIDSDGVILDGNGYAVEGGIGVGPEDMTEIVRNITFVDVTADEVTAWTPRQFTVTSSNIAGGIEGLFFGNVTVTDSRLGGTGILFSEQGTNLTVANNTFDGDRGVTVWERVQHARIVHNEFETSGTAVTIASVSGTTTDVLIADNRIDAGGGTGISIVEGETDALIRNNYVTNGSVGIDQLARDGRIVGNEITGNDYGIAFSWPGSSGVVTGNEITDNRVGVFSASSDAELRRNRIADNTDFGVQVTDENAGTVIDARDNDWGDPSGPSSAPANDSDAPFADPVTEALANGSGDAVSEGETPGVSNVRFDPISSVDEPDPEPEPEPTPEPTPEPKPAIVFSQVDFAAGPVIEQLGSDSEAFYSEQSRLIQFFHGSDGQVDRIGSPSTLAAAIDECVVAESFDVADATATVRFTIGEGCELALSLSSYEKPGPGWSRANASEQRLVDAAIGTFGPGTHTLTVALPTDAADNENASAEADGNGNGNASADAASAHG